MKNKNCEFCKEVMITVGVNTNTSMTKNIKLCYNPILMVIKTGGVLLQYCPYENFGECPYENRRKD